MAFKVATPKASKPRIDPEELRRFAEGAGEVIADVTTADAPLPAERRVISIPLDRIRDNPFNARRIYDTAIIKDRAVSLATGGQKVPAVVVEDPANPGDYILVDGHYRKRALHLAGKPDMECMVETVANDLALYKLSFLLNQERTPQSALDDALAWRDMLTRGAVAKEEDLCELTGLSWAMVNKTLAMGKLSEPVLLRIGESPEQIGVVLGYELFLYEKAVGVERCLTLIERIFAEKLTAREVGDIRKKAEASTGKRSRAKSRQYQICSGESQGVIKEWDSGKVSFEISHLSPDERRDLIADLRKRFDSPPKEGV